MSDSAPDFADIVGRLVGPGVSSATFIPLGDDALLAAVESLTALRHEIERCQAIATAEVARRSSTAFGVSGLAQRAGHASTGQLLQSITHSSKRETASLLGVGQMIAATDAAGDLQRQREADPILAEETPEPTPPWFAQLGAAVTSGLLTVEVGDAIRRGLGEPGDDVDEAMLATELAELIPLCRQVDADAARRAARQARDRIDVAGVIARADRQRHDQFWRLWVKADGMVRGEFELEPESGMLVKAVFDQLTHPRHINQKVRRSFGDPVHGDEHYADARAARQRDAADGLVQLLRAGASVDPSRLLNEKKPSVRLVVNTHSLATGHGTGIIEGHPDRIPLTSIHTRLCEGYLPVKFDDHGQVLDLGRDERLFTDKQKIALAIRDGGCMDPDCNRPPSWTEAHHIDHWQRDEGRTDIADGILLCRREHLRYHNQGWEVRREGSTYWLIPPKSVDPEQTPRLMKPKTPADIINPVDPARLEPDRDDLAERERPLPLAG